jgi:hypothetical protein
VQFYTQYPTTEVFIPAGSFAAVTTAAEGNPCSGGKDGTKLLDKATDECVTVTWTVPEWARVASAIPAEIVWVANDVNLAHEWAVNFGYKVLDLDTTLAKAASTALAGSPANLVNDVAQCTIHDSNTTFSVPGATFAAGDVVRFEICRDADASGGGAVDDIDSDVGIIGLQLTVTRAYMD